MLILLSLVLVALGQEVPDAPAGECDPTGFVEECGADGLCQSVDVAPDAAPRPAARPRAKTEAPACPDPGAQKATPEFGDHVISGDPVILGALDKSVIDAVIARDWPKIKACYTRERAKDARLGGGRLTQKFVVAPDGTVSRTYARCSDLDDPEVETCINERFKRLKFPEPKGGGIVIVRHDFTFSPD